MAETKRRRKGAVKMKKLLFIAHVPIAQSQYGRHIKLFHQIAALEKSGYDVDYIGNDGRFYYLCSKNAENMLTGAEKAGAESRPAFFTAVRLALEHGSGYDYAYICSEPFTPKFLGMLRRLKSLDIKVIMELQTYPYDKARLMEKRPFTRFRLLVDRLCRASLKRYVDVIASPSEDESIFSIPVVTFENSVEPGLIKRRNPSFHTKELHLLAFAGMEARNGYDRLIEGLRLYYATRQDFKIYLHLVGEGRLLTQWFRLAIRYGLGSYVIFHGEKYGAELDEIFDSCDLGVADLGVYRLGLAGFSGLNVSEYCARGLPFIYAGRELSLEAGVCFARRYPNTSEPVDIGSVVAFYKGVLQTANIGDRMFEFATAHYTWQKQFDGIFELLQNPTAGVEAIEDT
jgi:glycosyltransferase involved in cell wall biosynthesis